MTKKQAKITVQGTEIAIYTIAQKDYISITDIARYRNSDAPADVVKNWLRNRSTIEFLGLWEKLNNPQFKLVEFDQFRSAAGSNYFVLSPKSGLIQRMLLELLQNPANTVELLPIRILPLNLPHG